MDRRRRRGGRLLRALECVLFLTAALALGSYGFLRGRTLFYREYDAWAFERTLAGEPHSLRSFLDDRIDRLLGRERPVPPPAPRAETPPAAEPPAALQENTPNQQEWSEKRIRDYRESLGADRETAMARLDIPSLDVSAMVFPGTDDWTLNRAVGHIEGSARPGERGNVAIAGHRDSYFRPLGRIARNDPIILTTPQRTYRYRVERTEIVQPEDTRVLRRSETPTLTLVTCYPFYFVGDAPQRFIVQARLEDPGAESAGDAAPPAAELAASDRPPERHAPRPRRVVRLHPPRTDVQPPPERAPEAPESAAPAPEPAGGAATASAGRLRLVKRIGSGVVGAVKKPFGFFRRRAEGQRAAP